jgi:hypothetical protein
MLTKVIQRGFSDIQTDLSNIRQCIDFGNQIAALGVQLSHEDAQRTQMLLQEKAEEDRMRSIEDRKIRADQHHESLQIANEQRAIAQKAMKDQKEVRRILEQ